MLEHCYSTRVDSTFMATRSILFEMGVVVIDGLRFNGLRIDGSRDFHDFNRNVATAISL